MPTICQVLKGKNMNKMKSLPSRNKQCIENIAGRSLKNKTDMGMCPEGRAKAGIVLYSLFPFP